MIADDKVRGASRLPSFHKERKLNFEEFRFVFIDTEYLKYLRGFDSEIFFSSNTDYSKKPHLGILTNCHDRKYVIPLTSAKEKHIHWRDVTATNYRIYEEIDIRSAKTDQYDIIVDESDFNKLRQKNIPEDEFIYHKKIYEKQINSEMVAQYHCNYKLLESAADTYKKEVSSDS